MRDDSKGWLDLEMKDGRDLRACSRQPDALLVRSWLIP